MRRCTIPLPTFEIHSVRGNIVSACTLTAYDLTKQVTAKKNWRRYTHQWIERPHLMEASRVIYKFLSAQRGSFWYCYGKSKLNPHFPTKWTHMRKQTLRFSCSGKSYNSPLHRQ